MLRRSAFLALIATALAAAASLSSDDYISHIRYLSSPQLKGRGNGSPQLEKAARYLADHFRSYGARPVPGNDGYLQAFRLTASARLNPHSVLEYHAAGTRTQLRLQQDFVPVNLSSNGDVSAPVVFAGYGITAPEYNYDDYAGIDVHGKIVLILRHEPQEFDEKSVFSGKSYTAHSELASKASNAKLHGAVAVLLVNDAQAHPADEDKLATFGSAEGPENSGVEFAQVTSRVAGEWLARSGKNLVDIGREIDKDLHPRSFALPPELTVRCKVDITRALKRVHNVVAYVPGSSSKEYVIVGAHYDHLGLGGQYSLAPSQTGTVHPGADDNASGAAGLLELARNLQGRPPLKRGVLFIAFAGEELGLLGSGYYVAHPELPLSEAVAMINMDMIGRIRDHKVFVGGSGTGTTFAGLLKAEDGKEPITTDLTERAGYGSSDHTWFTIKQIPTLFFFSGLHADYHRPSDTWDKINAPEAIELLTYVSDVIDNLANEPDKPKFVRVSEPPSSAASASAGSSSGYGPNFGSIPDFTELPNGVRFADIKPGSPAAKAGLLAGDILTEFDGKPIRNLYDFTYALRARKPGDQVLVRVLRGAQTLQVNVLLTERK